ncbi:ATP-binding protein [Propionispora vibrioides]|uniref:histidine kinase n=1 Tax=Propionispora vibrioides TaxID=112903 RepID=A0A1H8XV49_9FIRM|nr:ATP-binding protein [Propionispora vibrioides]SEP43924.1 PAS domain S-box-containing protein [Propionispora vibrioides]
MDIIQLAVVGSSIGTISIILVYIYLYIIYRETFMGIWALSWLILLSRYIIFDTGLLPWRHSFLGLTIYQLLIFISVLMFVRGTHIFINKFFNKWWIYGAIIVTITSIFINASHLPLAFKLLLPIYVCCFVGIWLGLIFIRQTNLPGIGRLITGYAYIFWSLFNLTAPFTIGGVQFLPIAYSIGGILRLTIAAGTLIVYFEKTRTDLVKQETMYRLLTENAIDIIYHYQIFPKAKILYLSPSVLQLTGYSSNEHYADHTLFYRLIYPEDQPLFDTFKNNIPKSLSTPLVLRITRKDDTILWIEQKCVPIYDENNRLVALQGIVRDITTRKKLEQMSSLFDRMNMVGSMAATVAHEIRNPLTTVRGYLQVLGRKEKYQNDKEKFTLMTEEIDRANSIIKEYLSLSREKLINLKICPLNHIIQSLFPLVQADAISSKVDVVLELSNISDLLLDENEIRQLLLNLSRNAIEAMTNGGKLTIRTFQQKTDIVLSISDQGTGIPSHILDKLGTPFITTKDTGTGLGLPICYQIAHRHNATIKIDTGHTGTTFFVYFNSETS